MGFEYFALGGFIYLLVFAAILLFIIFFISPIIYGLFMIFKIFFVLISPLMGLLGGKKKSSGIMNWLDKNQSNLMNKSKSIKLTNWRFR